MSKGADRYWMPMESQYSFSSRCPSKEKCSLRIISSWLSAASVVCFWYSAFSANLLTTSSGTAVWYLTMSAPHSLAARAISLAIARSPLWLTPASAMIVTGMRPSFLWSGLVFQLAAHFFQFFQLAHIHPAVFPDGVDADL